MTTELREWLEQNLLMHDAHRASIMRLWRAIALLFLLQVMTIMGCVIAMGSR
jgi:lipopolysaccharide export LptBFGC system permease protein LptF